MALTEEKVPDTSGKKKGQCSKGKEYSVRHESNERAQKPEHAAASPSEPSLSRGRSEVFRGKEVSKAKVTMGPFFDNHAGII